MFLVFLCCTCVACFRFLFVMSFAPYVLIVAYLFYVACIMPFLDASQ